MSSEVSIHVAQPSSMTGGSSIIVATPPNRTSYQRVKRALSRLIGFVTLFAVTPLIALCAVLVRLTSAGPCFYSQIRLGYCGRQFRIYKLRTMRYRCEDGTGAVWSTVRDPRVTRVGRILRRLHLDELPQLWNIARGDMCFIGHRPERPEIVEKLLEDVPNYNDRLTVFPGLTGLSQVLQTADTGVEDARTKLRNDKEYQRRECFSLDVRIVVGTAMVILGFARPTVARLLRLDAKATLPHPSSACSESIFDAHLPKLFDSGILGMR